MVEVTQREGDGAWILSILRSDGTYNFEFNHMLVVRLRAAGVNDFILESLGMVYDENHVQTAEREFDIRVTLPDATHVATVEGILEAHAALVPSKTKASIQADGMDSSIITLTGQTSFGYKAWLLYAVVGQGSVNDGSLGFLTDTPGTYVLELTIGSNTGFALVEAV